TELERQIARAQAAEAAMLGLEAMREAAAALYLDETGSSWRPASGPRANHGAALTSAVIEGRDYLRARAESRRRASMPEGTQMLSLNPRCLVAFAGNGVLERLVIAAKEKGVHVVDRRGPLGTNPRRTARDAAAV